MLKYNVQKSHDFMSLEEVMVKYTFPPTRIFDMDETRISSVQDPGFTLTTKGQNELAPSAAGSKAKT
jgi:hypothetical protein